MQATIQNRTIFCRDNLDILKGIDTESIDLIYLDPPFNKKKTFTAPIKSSAEGASFNDIFRREDIKDEWVQSIKEDDVPLYELLEFTRKAEGRTSYNFCYLVYMSIRLIEIQRILKKTGSVYLHCDPTMSHYLKLAMDCIFGEENFRNEIVWHYGKWSNKTTLFQGNHDILFWYGKGKNYHFNPLYYERMSQKAYHTNIVNGKKQLLIYDIQNTSAEIIDQYKKKGYSIVHSTNPGVVEHDVWTYVRDKSINILNSQSLERTGYPTQKPLSLLERIIKASSNEGDVVFDPFCGCATTCVAAERLNRQWIGIDVSVKAYELVKQRLAQQVEHKDAMPLYYEELVHFRTDTPERTDLTQNTLIEQKFVYVISHQKSPGEYKVGIAKNWNARLNSYQTADPDRAYKMEYTKLTSHFREIEKYIHEKFDNKHEWVRGELADIIHAIDNKVVR